MAATGFELGYLTWDKITFYNSLFAEKNVSLINNHSIYLFRTLKKNEKKTLLVNSPFPQISRNRKINLIFLIPQGTKFDEELGTLIMNGPILTNQV